MTTSENNVDLAKEIEKIAVGLLARREHSVLELEQKLRLRGYRSDDIEPVINYLQARRWQSDQRFAEAYIRYRSERGFGWIKIRAELLERGVSKADITNALAEQQIDWYQLARDAYNKRFNHRRMTKPMSASGAIHAEMQKHRRFLHYRGFSAEHIQYALSED